MPKILQILKERTTPIGLVCLILGIVLVSNLSKLGATDENLGATVLRAPQGGTGISSATTSDIGKALVVSSTNPFQYKLDTVASSGGGSTTTLTATQVAYGSPDNTVTSSANFTFNSSTNQLLVPNVSSTSVTTTNLYVSGTTTLGSNLIMTHPNFITAHGIKGDASDGLYITANNGTAVADFGVGNTANSIFNGGVNIDGQTRLATSLTGLAYLTSGVVSATNTINVATGTITGGFFQTDFTDCDADNQTVAYDLTTGKFGCGDDDSGAGAVSLTNTLLAFGNTDNTITSSTGLSFITSTNRLVLTGTVSSTNGLFLSVTTTNIAIGSDSISDITGTGLEINAGSLQLTTPYQDGSAYDSRFVNIDGDAMTGPLSVNGESSNAPGGSGLFFGYSPDGTGRVKIELSGDTESYIDFTDTGLDFEGRIHYDQATNLLSFVAGGAQTFHIDGTTLTASNTAILGSFTQTGLGDCDADNQTVSYDITTGAFGCGDDDTGAAAVSLTNTLIAFGSADNALTSSTALSFNTTSLRLILNGTVSSTNGLFFNATSTNLFAANGNFTRATSTDFFATNASFTSITSTNLSFTRAVGTNVTSTNLSISGLTSLAGLTFTNATGTGQFRIATTTITGGFFQTDLANCNADTETVSYNATTGKFGCGDDDSGGASTVSTTNANGVNFTDVSPASFADNNTTELWNDATRPNITPQSANNPVIINVNYMLRGASATDNDFVIRVVRENDPGSTTPTCDLTSDVQVGASSSGGSLISAFTTNLTDIQSANGMLIDFPATTTAVYYTICTSASSTVSAAPTSSVLHVGLSELQGSGGGTSREFTRIVTSTGSSAWTKPVTSTGFTGAIVWCVGGGGGGGGAGTNNTIGGGGAGGGGSYRYLSALDLSSTSSVNVTVGAGGAGGSAGNNSGTAGGTSSFSTFITCSGGAAGVAANAAETTAAGGAGSGGSVNGTGGYGGPNGAYTDSWRGYGGAACVNQNWSSTIQDAFSPNVTPGGILGQWCGAGAPRPPSWSAVDYTGGQGASFGAGGSGGQRVTGSVAGADGRQGVIVIIEQYQ